MSRVASARLRIESLTLFVALSSSENAHRAFFRVGNADTYDIAIAENSFRQKHSFESI